MNKVWPQLSDETDAREFNQPECNFNEQGNRHYISVMSTSRKRLILYQPLQSNFLGVALPFVQISSNALTFRDPTNTKRHPSQ
ncbi:hypothetical protein J6590_069691 [Homalodisca vitripennis]|nr:hypothetical protein J6590_069691 [Homalodisca vitripennis]